MYAALKPFEEVRGHELSHADLAPRHSQVLLAVGVLGRLARMEVLGRDVDGKQEAVQLVVYLSVVDGTASRGEARSFRDGLVTLGEGADGGHVVVPLDVLAAPCHRHLVEHLEEVEVEHVGERVCGSQIGRQLRPLRKGALGVCEHVLDGALYAQLSVPRALVSRVGES